jgi:ABC-type transport system involved in multi-copper enzyme maturation permease subunit
LKQLLAVAANTYRETVRERVLFGLVGFVALMTVSGILMGQLSIRQDEKIIKDLGLASIQLAGTAIALLVGAGLVSKDVERRSLYPILAKPISRDRFYLGKFMGLSFTLLVNTGTMTAGLYLTLFALGRSLDGKLLAAATLLYLSFLLVIALALFFSSTTSASLASLCTLGVVLAGQFSDVVMNARDVLPGVPPGLIRAVYLMLPNFRNFDVKDLAAHGDPISSGQILSAALYGAAYTAIVLSLGLVAFRRRDFA